MENINQIWGKPILHLKKLAVKKPPIRGEVDWKVTEWQCASVFVAGVTILLSQTVFSLLVGNVITKTSEAVPLIGESTSSAPCLDLASNILSLPTTTRLSPFDHNTLLYYTILTLFCNGLRATPRAHYLWFHLNQHREHFHLDQVYNKQLLTSHRSAVGSSETIALLDALTELTCSSRESDLITKAMSHWSNRFWIVYFRDVSRNAGQVVDLKWYRLCEPPQIGFKVHYRSFRLFMSAGHINLKWTSKIV